MSKPTEKKTPRRVTGLGGGTEAASQPPHGELSKSGPSLGGQATGASKVRQMKGVQVGRNSAGRANSTNKKIRRQEQARVPTGTYLDFQKGIKDFWLRRGITQQGFNDFGA